VISTTLLDPDGGLMFTNTVKLNVSSDAAGICRQFRPGSRIFNPGGSDPVKKIPPTFFSP
jgi:hypothetical protein